MRLNKSIAFNLTAKDKRAIRKRAEELGISMSAMIRGIVLDKYKSLQIGYLKAGYHDIDIKGLRPPRFKGPPTAEHISMKECVDSLKVIFANGLNVLGKLEDSELGIKSQKKIKSIERKKIRSEFWKTVEQEA